MNTPAVNGFHPVLERDEQPYLCIDACMQIWPDAQFEIAHRHGVTCYNVTAVHPGHSVGQALEAVMWYHLLPRSHGNLLLVEAADDIVRAHDQGKAALLMAAQGGDFVENKLHRIEAFYRLGLRMFLPAYNSANLICDGCLDRNDGGLTAFGELVVAECSRVGMVVDCTHVSPRSALDIIARSSQPCVFSHSNPDGMVHNPRNISDEAIKACAARGGVIGLVAWGPLVLKDHSTQWPTVDDFVDIVDYTAQLLGSMDNIGLSTDMSLGTYPYHEKDPWGTPEYKAVTPVYDRYITGDVRSPMRGLNGFSVYPEVVNLIERLQARGYSREHVAGLLGGNFLRLFRQVWK